jgi:hypothetical protein
MSCGGGHIGPYGENVSKRFFSETNWIIETKLPRNDHWKVLYKVCVIYADRKSKMATTAGHRLTLDPMGKCSNAFYSETTNMIKAKLYMNVHWMVLYKLYVFCSDMKFKMAATAGLSLTLNPMGKMFQNVSSTSHLGFPIGITNRNFVEDLPMIIPGQFGFNCPSGFREEAF